MENFKSYGRRKVTLHLTKGLTVVSGPNGCGKSNISDAIQFVLGQLSSKTIRTEQLSGVIFAGTKEGQKKASYAKVTLVLDNSTEPKEIPIATNEVQIGRKVHLDGRSEYYLNGSRITRSEIIDTLGICGISIDGYNVIRQGEIAKFSNMSAIELRELFEEIAGIAAYDEKKAKAQDNLEKARNKLQIATVRVEESIKKLNRLEQEKKDALKYQELKNRIKNTEAKLLHARIRQLKEQISETKQEISTLRTEQEVIKKKMVKLVEEISDYDEKIQKAKAQVKDASGDSLNNLNATIEALAKKQSEELSGLKQRKSELEAIGLKKQQLELKLTETLEENRDLKERNSLLQDNLEGTDVTLKKIQQELKKQRKLLENSRSTEKLDRLEEVRSKISHINNELSSLDSRITILNNDLKINQTRIADKEQRVVKVAGILAQFLSRKANYVNELSEFDEKIRKLEVRINEQRMELQTVEEELKDNEERFRQTAVTIKRIQTELATTKKVMEQIAQRNRGIKLILKARDNGTIDGIHGTIGELCKTHPKYSVALSITAGKRTDFVVVENDEVAAQCIMLIKKAKAGRVTFLPLNKLRPRVIDPKINEEGFIGRAIDLVKFKEQFRKAIQYVFGQTVIVKDLATARRIGFNYRAVSLDGDVVNPSGTITGGFYSGGKGNKISLIVEDKEELPQLKEKLRELEDERERLLEYRRMIDEELNDKLLPQLNNLKRNRDLMNRDLKATNEEIDLRSEENLTIQKDFEDLTKKHEELKREVQELTERQEDREASLREYKDLEITLKAEIDTSGVQELIEEIEQKETEQEEITEILNELRMKQFKASSNLEDNLKQIEEIKQELAKISAKEPKKAEEVTQAQQKTESITKELEMKKKQREELMETFRKNQIKVEKLESEQKALRKELENKREEQNQRIIIIERMINEQNNAEQQIKELEQIAGERDLPFIFAEDEEISIEVLKEVLNGLKAELDDLPEINMKAISQYEEELELNQKLVKKQKFVEKDFEAINQAIKEIETEKREKFMTVFNGISKDFNKIFGILSPDGRAKLELEDPDDPFNAGIRIMANPGGKKITSMLSLSGGEKSLTALAMIFAIQRYKPAPFYIFDEIDAFLDINNVHKVATLVREMSKDTQILIISLRAPMIAAAEKIFGVTAGEDRISQIVTVSLDEIMKIVEKTDFGAEAEVYDY